MKNLLSIFLSIVILVSCSISAFAILPPEYQAKEDMIVHAEGRDPNDPRIAYDEKGTAYFMGEIFVGFSNPDFEAAKQFGAELISYAKNLSGVTTATTTDFDYYEGWESYFIIRVELAFPYDDYETVYESLNNYPGIKRVNRSWLFSTELKTYYYGDVNYDGQVTAEDARQILRFSVSLDMPNNYHISIGDFSEDGFLTAADARTCLRTAVDLEIKRVYIGNEAT